MMGWDRADTEDDLDIPSVPLLKASEAASANDLDRSVEKIVAEMLDSKDPAVVAEAQRLIAEHSYD
jgi:hypothetical protein